MARGRLRRKPDFLDELIAERSAGNAEFPRLVEAALDRRRLLRHLAARREALGLSQGEVAERMGTSQPAVARLESGEVDARVSTLERFAAAVGHRIEYRIARARRNATVRAAPRRGSPARRSGG